MYQQRKLSTKYYVIIIYSVLQMLLFVFGCIRNVIAVVKHFGRCQCQCVNLFFVCCQLLAAIVVLHFDCKQK